MISRTAEPASLPAPPGQARAGGPARKGRGGSRSVAGGLSGGRPTPRHLPWWAERGHSASAAAALPVQTIDGGGIERGLFIYAGAVSVTDLAIDDTVAKAAARAEAAACSSPRPAASGSTMSVSPPTARWAATAAA